MMPHQHSRPFIISKGTGIPSAHALERKFAAPGGDGGLSESWLQQFLFDNPAVLPIEAIEPVFGPLIPICRELPSSAGPLDILFGSASGLLTLVECKLWKNPEARRQVVGQILDYAKDLSRWKYDDLQQAVSRAGGPTNLYQSLFSAESELGEAGFVDAVSRNLRLGRFLLLIVGDGIRESVEEISEFLQVHAHLNFSFALVETALFSIPEEIGGGTLVAPRVLCRTVEIERAVVRIEGDGITVSAVPEETTAGTGNIRRPRTKISEQVFYEALGAQPSTVAALKDFFSQAEAMGLIVTAGDNSLMLKSDDGEFNFAVFRVDGTVRNLRIASRTNQLGFPEIGRRYLDRFAKLFDGGTVDTSVNIWHWSAKKQGRFLTIEEVLAVRDKWLDLIRDTLAEIDAAMR